MTKEIENLRERLHRAESVLEAIQAGETDAVIGKDSNNVVVTRLKQAEQALREKEERLRLIMEAGRMASCELDPAAGKISICPRMREIFGISTDDGELFREEILSCMHEDDRERLLAADERALATGEGFEMELPIRRKDGETRWIRTQVAPLHESDGRIVRLIAIVMDITDRKKNQQALEENRQRYEYLLQSSSKLRTYHNMVGRSKQMQNIYLLVQQIAGVDTTVLITGETGTGKELVAEALHTASPRKNGPLIKVNCLTLAEELLDSELFGHVRGAFTGAYNNKIGRVEAADEGTLFLDEIGDITPRIQLKLLRFLQEREYERVGESKTRKADVRIVAATNADLAKKVEEGSFRNDLYFRLKVLPVHMPSLHDREGDIPLLIHHFCSYFAKKFNKPVKGVSVRSMRLMHNYPWPGNVRELEHALEHGVLLCPGELIEPKHLPEEIQGERVCVETQNNGTDVDKERLVQALVDAKGRKTEAARMLGMSRRTLYRKLHKFGLIE